MSPLFKRKKSKSNTLIIGNISNITGGTINVTPGDINYYIDVTPPGRNLVDWNCPSCGESNTDLQDQYTHCAYCGEVVYVLGEDGAIDDLHWKVDL